MSRFQDRWSRSVAVSAQALSVQAFLWCVSLVLAGAGARFYAVGTTVGTKDACQVNVEQVA